MSASAMVQAAVQWKAARQKPPVHRVFGPYTALTSFEDMMGNLTALVVAASFEGLIEPARKSNGPERYLLHKYLVNAAACALEIAERVDEHWSAPGRGE